MIKYELVGLQKVDYTNKQGRQISGYNLHLTYDDSNVDGIACERVFVRSIPSHLALGSQLRIFYNKYGSIEDIDILN